MPECCAIPESCIMLEPLAIEECAMPGDSAIDDMACALSGNGSLTVLLMMSASGRKRYQTRPPATMATPTSIDLRFVMLVSPFRYLESRQSTGPRGQAADRTQGLQAAIVLNPKCVDRLLAAGAERVQIPAVSTQGDIVHPACDDGCRAVAVEQPDRAIRCDPEARDGSGAVAGEAETPVVRHDRPAGSALVGQHDAADELQAASPQRVRRRGAGSRGLRDEHQVVRSDREAERRTAGGGE